MKADCVLLSLLVPALSSPAQEPLLKTFRPPGVSTPFSQLGAALALVPGDLDGDGDLDVFYTSLLGPMRVVENDGTGNFVLIPFSHTQLPLVASATCGVLRDIDGDRDLDIFVGRGSPSLAPIQDELFLNDGSARFTQVTASHLPQVLDLTLRVEAADLDGDGDDDLVKLTGVAGTPGGGTVEVYANDGSARFSVLQSIPMQEYESALGLGDVDGDGDADLVVGGNQGTSRLYLNDGTGSFTLDQTGRLQTTAQDWAMRILIVDLDADGDNDIVIVSLGQNQAGQNQLHLNDGQGRFTDVSSLRLPPGTAYYTWGVAVDIDLDGDLDLALATRRVNQLYLNDGTGRFTDASATRFEQQDHDTWYLDAADVDGDGDPDLLAGNRGSSRHNGAADLFFNTLRQVHTELPFRLGTMHRLDLYGSPGDAATMFLGHAVQHRVMPPFGNVFLPLGGMIAFPTVVVGPDRITHLGLLVPGDPGLIGLPVVLQALIGPQGSLLDRRTSNYVLGRIEP